MVQELPSAVQRVSKFYASVFLTKHFKLGITDMMTLYRIPLK